MKKKGYLKNIRRKRIHKIKKKKPELIRKDLIKNARPFSIDIKNRVRFFNKIFRFEEKTRLVLKDISYPINF